MTVTIFSKAIPSYILPQLQEFITAFYLQSDTPPPSEKSTDPYLNYLTSDATLVMASNTFVDHENISTLRQNMWLKVTKRHHVVTNVAYLDDSNYIVNGYVDYTLINGKDLTTEWAAIIKFHENTESLKMKYYQVYLDSAPMAKALQ